MTKDELHDAYEQVRLALGNELLLTELFKMLSTEQLEYYLNEIIGLYDL